MTDAEKKDRAILVVDDDGAMRSLLVMALQSLGDVDIFSAANSPEALSILEEILAQYSSIAILSDYEMGGTGLDGDELIRAVRTSTDPKIVNLPIVIHSGMGSDAKDGKTIIQTAVGAEHEFEYIRKPALPKDIRMKIAQVLAANYPKAN
jgi:CheY-like chemotaxis protein